MHMNPEQDEDKLEPQNEQVALLLRALPRAKPRAGLVDDIRHARQERLRQEAQHADAKRADAKRKTGFQYTLWASAATLFMALLVLYQYDESIRATDTNHTPIVASLNTPQQVNFLVKAKQAHDEVTFSLHVPPEWELYGYHGQKILSWNGKLKAGNNLLTIPVVALQPKSGTLIMQIKHKQFVKEYKLEVDVKDHLNKEDKAQTDTNGMRWFT